jgi:hypothetical protein
MDVAIVNGGHGSHCADLDEELITSGGLEGAPNEVGTAVLGESRADDPSRWFGWRARRRG